MGYVLFHLKSIHNQPMPIDPRRKVINYRT